MSPEIKSDELARFSNLSYDDFRRLAQDASLSRYEKIGFPDRYREGFEPLIFKDICAKIPALTQRDKNVVDIGPGCSELPLMIADLSREKGHHLTWIDSAEMLALLPDASFIDKVPGQFPASCKMLLDARRGRFDAVVAYSVLHYVMPGFDIFAFLDAAMGLLATAGVLLIGDIPNVSKRKRFFSSENGRLFHRTFTQTDTDPHVAFNILEPGRIDDSVILALLLRARTAGFESYIVAQDARLPMQNRREDILIVKP